MPDVALQREFALQTVQKIRAAGFQALWAGGCVRDELLGIVPKDYDVATDALPDQIRELFGRRRTIPVGAAFGVMTVLGPRRAGQIEVATFRTDAAYSDGRHPDSVRYSDAEHDAQRRDFTINGLFYDPIAEIVVDYVGGQQDLERRIVRAIGNPRARLREDRLRMLRAVRFAATFDFTLEPETLRAIQEMAADITSVSAERIGMEIRRMLVDPKRTAALRLLRETNLLQHVLPEVAKSPAETFEDTCRVLAALRDPPLALALAALLSGASELTAEAIGRRLRYTNHDIARAAWMLRQLPVIEHARDTPWPRLQRVLIHDAARELVALHEAIAGPDEPALAFCRERLAWPPERLNPPPLVDGSDLIRHGLAPGPEFSVLIEKIRDAQLNGEIEDRDQALALADRLRRRDETLP